MKWALLLIFISLNASALDLSQEGLYKSTKQDCLKVSESDLHNLNFDKLNAGYFPSQEFTAIQTFIRSDSAKEAAINFNVSQHSKVTDYVLRSDSFNLALAECYPNAPELRQFFIKSILVSDRAGKIVGITAALLLFRGFGRLFSAIELWNASAFRYLKLLQKSADVVLIDSLLTGDQTQQQPPDQTTWKDNGSAKQETQKLDEMLRSLRLQVQEEEKKIKNCGQCPDLNQFNSEKAALLKILATANNCL